jgi:hypothetical protein
MTTIAYGFTPVRDLRNVVYEFKGLSFGLMASLENVSNVAVNSHFLYQTTEHGHAQVSANRIRMGKAANPLWTEQIYLIDVARDRNASCNPLIDDCHAFFNHTVTLVSAYMLERSAAMRNVHHMATTGLFEKTRPVPFKLLRLLGSKRISRDPEYSISPLALIKVSTKIHHFSRDL